MNQAKGWLPPDFRPAKGASSCKVQKLSIQQLSGLSECFEVRPMRLAKDIRTQLQPSVMPDRYSGDPGVLQPGGLKVTVR